jgi:hypothetical protein
METISVAKHFDIFLHKKLFFVVKGPAADATDVPQP